MSKTETKPTSPSSTPSRRPFKLIGELMNNSFGRAARAWKHRDLAGFQRLAKLQADLGADYLTLNIDGTQSMRVTPREMYDFLPELIPAIQQVTSVPIAFDNPSVEFHRRCLEVYDRTKSGRPIFNSIAASRRNLDEMFELIAAASGSARRPVFSRVCAAAKDFAESITRGVPVSVYLVSYEKEVMAQHG